MRVVRAALRQKGARQIVSCCCCQLPLRRLPARKPTAQFVLLLRSIPTLSAGGIDAFSRTTDQEVRDLNEERPAIGCRIGDQTIRLRATFINNIRQTLQWNPASKRYERGSSYPLNRCCNYARAESVCSEIFCFSQ
jgi:hypothetical protein